MELGDGAPAHRHRGHRPALADAGITADGDVSVLGRLGALLQPGDEDFAIVTP